MIVGHDIFLRLHIFTSSSKLVVIFAVVVFLTVMVVFAAHCRNIYGIAVHGSTHVIDTASRGLISLLAVVKEGDQEEK